MGDKTLKIDVSNHEAQEVEERNDDDTDNSKNDILEYKDIDIKPKDSVTIQNTNDDKLHTIADEKIHQNISESKIDIGAYLRSEFPSGIALDMKGKQDVTVKLTKYKEIDITSNRRENKQSIRKRRKVYSRNTIVVQFMGGENLPENKVQMIYDPEIRNFTVKTMFGLLIMMHFFLFGGTLYLTSTNEDIYMWYRNYGVYLAIFGLVVTVILILCMVCVEKMRVGFRCSVAVFGTLLSLVAVCSSLINLQFQLTSLGVFVYTFATMFFTDIICILVGCTTLCSEDSCGRMPPTLTKQYILTIVSDHKLKGKVAYDHTAISFDYTSKLMYAIVIGGGLLIYAAVACGLDWMIYFTTFGFKLNPRYFKDRLFDTVVASILTLIVLVVTVAELHIMLDGETIEMAEDDYFFGAYLLLVAIVDFPIRLLRKKGYLGEKDEGEGDDDE